MTATHGKNGSVKVGSDTLGETTKWSLNINTETADTTTQNANWQSHLPGIPGWSGSCDALFDQSDTAQAALEVGDSVTLGFYWDGQTSGKKYYSGTATVTGIQPESDMKGPNKVSFTFQGNGALTIETVGS